MLNGNSFLNAMLKNSFAYCLSLCALTTVVLLNGCSPDDDDKQPVVTAAEGLFINEISASGDDWVELYNSTNAIKNISGYKISDDGASYTLPAGTLVPAKGYLVIFCNDGNTGLNTNFKLSSAGETVTLKNATNQVAETVTYPKLDNGQSYGRYPDGSDNLAISGITSQGSSNDASNAPAITSTMRTPNVPGLNQSVLIQAQLTNTAQLNSVKLFYRFNGADYQSLNMTLTGAYYNATLPAQANTGRMDYYIEAKTTTGSTTYKPFDAPGDSYYYLLNTDVLPQLVINEFMASSTTCCPDMSSGTAEYDDWIEIYNAGNSTIDLSGMYLSDQISDPFKSKIPQGITIAAGEFKVFWADEQGSQGPLHLNFKLSKSGEEVGLFYIDGRTIHSKEFSGQTDNKSFGLTLDGDKTSAWRDFSSPTPGTTNNP